MSTREGAIETLSFAAVAYAVSLLSSREQPQGPIKHVLGKFDVESQHSSVTTLPPDWGQLSDVGFIGPGFYSCRRQIHYLSTDLLIRSKNRFDHLDRL